MGWCSVHVCLSVTITLVSSQAWSCQYTPYIHEGAWYFIVGRVSLTLVGSEQEGGSGLDAEVLTQPFTNTSYT